jgi:ATP-binding cassette subfamily C (CFTR/MRP) protein 4
MYSPYLIGSPFNILAVSLILAYVVSPSAILGLAISVFHMPIIFFLAVAGGKARAKINKFGDLRIKYLTNFIEGIKIFKFYAWEIAYVGKICEIRKMEIGQRYLLSNLNGLIGVFSLGGLGFCIFVTFFVYLEVLEVNLTLGEMYLIILIYFSSHLSLVHMGTISILTLIVVKDGLKRIGDILLLPEFSQMLMKENEKKAVSLLRCAVSNKPGKIIEVVETKGLVEDEPSSLIFQNLDLEIETGQLLMIIGSVGCGKTCFLKSLLQEFYIIQGSISINGKTSYSSEVPWIISSTIKENILMGSEMDSERYSKVIESTALDKDLEGFLMKDETWIGDRGVTLSGGQKARINLARALYRPFDILLLDDPLSSVDPQVANHIFENCILKLKNEGKTIVLVTHQLQFLSKADKILLLENRLMKFLGNFEELNYHQEFLSNIQQKEFGEIFDGKDNLMVVGNQVIFQEFLYWSSHREKGC